MATVTYEEAPRPGERAKGKPSRRRVAIWFVIVALLLALVGGGLFAFDRFRSKAIADFFASQVPPPTPVAAVAAEVGPMPRYLDGIGTLIGGARGHGGARGRRPGDRHRVHRRRVGGGRRPLVQLNDAPEQADLASYQASERLAIANLERTRQLARRDFATQATVDQNQQALEEARAGIARSRAVIDQKLIKAPFAGELGLRQVELGQYVDPGDTLVTLTDLGPALRQLHPARAGPLVGRGRAAGWSCASTPIPGEVFEGKVSAIEPQVDPTTRVMRIQATLANPEAPAAARHVRQRSRRDAPAAGRGERAGDRGGAHALRRFRVRRGRGRQGRGRQAQAQGGADLRRDRTTFRRAGWRSRAASPAATSSSPRASSSCRTARR